MKVSYNLRNCTLEVDGKDVKEAFVQLSSAVEVFSHNQCGACGSPDVAPCVRENAGNTYYEMRCMNCRATLGFGQRRQDGALYPRRKDKNGQWLDNSGWTKFERSGGSDFE
jgi:hypothetical protein